MTDSYYRMLRDVDLFRSRISKLDGAADLGDYLVKLVNDKTVTQDQEPPAKGIESNGAAEDVKPFGANPQDATNST